MWAYELVIWIKVCELHLFVGNQTDIFLMCQPSWAPCHVLCEKILKDFQFPRRTPGGSPPNIAWHGTLKCGPSLWSYFSVAIGGNSNALMIPIKIVIALLLMPWGAKVDVCWGKRGVTDSNTHTGSGGWGGGGGLTHPRAHSGQGITSPHDSLTVECADRIMISHFWHLSLPA